MVGRSCLGVTQKREDNFASEKHHSRNHRFSLGLRKALDPLISIDDIQNVQKLSLVFMDPLHHDIKQKVFRNGNALRSLDELRQAMLALEMRFVPSLLNRFVFSKVLQHRESGEIRGPRR